MRIAIYAQPRSGSTVLARYVAKSLPGYKLFLEPFNPTFSGKYSDYEIWEKDNVVTKFLLRRSDAVKSIKRINKCYDKVINLTRENDLEGAESELRAKFAKKWHERYSYDATKVDPNILAEAKYYREWERNFITKLKGFQITYEKIYYEKVGIPILNNYIGIKTNKYIHLLDKKNKYRVNIKDDKTPI